MKKQQHINQIKNSSKFRTLIFLLSILAFVGFGSLACAIQGNQAAAEQGAIVAPENIKQVEIAIEGMTCSSCAVGVKTMLKHTKGVISAEASYERKEAIVKYDTTQTNEKTVLAVVSKFGYGAKVK